MEVAEHERSDLAGRVFGHAGDDVRVGVVGQCYRGVPENLRDDLDRDGGLQRLGRESVAEIVQAYPAQLRRASEVVEAAGEHRRVQLGAGFRTEHEIVV